MMCADTGRSNCAHDAWYGNVREALSSEACWHTSTEQHCVDDCCDARSVVADVQGHARDIKDRVETRARGLRGSTAGRELMALGGTCGTGVQGGHMSHISWSGSQDCDARDHVTMSGGRDDGTCASGDGDGVWIGEECAASGQDSKRGALSGTCGTGVVCSH